MARLSKKYDLQKTNPDLVRQWHPTRNGSLTPRDVTPGSNRQIWWICSRKHEWQTSVHYRTRGDGCPFCGRKRKVENGNGKELAASLRTEDIGFGGSIRKVRETQDGRVLVEMSREEWERLSTPATPPENLGAAIIEFRKRLGLSQAAFGELVGHHRNWISAIERDLIIRLSHKTYKRIIATISG